MSFEKIQQLVNSLNKSAEDNQKVFTPILAAKLAKAIDIYPSDQTIGAMSRVISKMASNNTLSITRLDLKKLYNQLYSRNTKFAELFQDELGAVETVATPAFYNRDDAKELNQFEVGDAVLANALTSVFDKDAPLKMYSQKIASNALNAVASSLDAWNLTPTVLEVNAGNDKFLVIKADYETPKGITSFYIPVETPQNQKIEASVFMGNAGPQELNHINIKTYLTSCAGTKLKVNGDSILGVLTAATAENREVSDAELALTRLNATKQGKSEFFQNQVVGLKIAEASKKDVELPKYGEFQSFEKEFTSVYGQASWKFGKENVSKARENITRDLLSFGFKNPQITVNKTDDNTVFYSVSLDAGRVGFMVPVKMSDGKFNKPSILLCNGSAVAFNKDGINQLYVNNQSDFKSVAVASPLFGLGSNDLVNNIRQAIDSGNNDKAEDALNVLANTGDETAYALGFKIFMNGLSNKKEASMQSLCSKTIKNSSSEHPICVHTGLPTHKVYQDKDGNCRPLYRRGMEETYEGAIFNNSKILG